MKCLVINLDRSQDRLAHMTSEFARIGIEFERVAAVDAQSRSDLQETPMQLNPLTQLPLTNAEIACFLSHKACWAKIADGDDAYGVVFEDDIVFSGQCRRDACRRQLDSGRCRDRQARDVLHAKTRDRMKRRSPPATAFRCPGSSELTSARRLHPVKAGGARSPRSTAEHRQSRRSGPLQSGIRDHRPARRSTSSFRPCARRSGSWRTTGLPSLLFEERGSSGLPTSNPDRARPRRCR